MNHAIHDTCGASHGSHPSFVVTDQEGFWNPKNRINWVTLSDSGKPNFYGNMLGYHDVDDESDSAMVQPLCWITNAFDRSPAELLWVDSPRWGPLHGSLLNLSYGYGKVFLVPHEKVDGVMQGGMIELPIPSFPTGVMRGRFHPGDGQLYLCGMFSWAGNATHPGGLYRLRATGDSMHLPVELRATMSGLKLTFTEALDPASLDIKNLRIKNMVAQANRQLRVQPRRREALGSSRREVVGRLEDPLAGHCRPTTDVVHGDQIRSALGNWQAGPRDHSQYHSRVR